jgi:hypothetical protein
MPKNVTLKKEEFTALLKAVTHEIESYKAHEQEPESGLHGVYYFVLLEFRNHHLKRMVDMRDKYQVSFNDYQRAAVLYLFGCYEWVELDPYLFALFHKIQEAIRNG